MSPRQLRAVALGLAALLLLWFASELLSKRSDRITASLALAPVSEATTDRVTITRGADPAVLAKGADTAWTVNGYAASRRAVTDLLAALRDSTPAELAAESPGSFARLGVDSAGGRWIRVAGGGRTLVELITGQNGPAFGTLYVRRPGDTQVFLWRGRSLPGPTRGVDEWRGKAAARGQPGSARAPQHARGKGGVAPAGPGPGRGPTRAGRWGPRGGAGAAGALREPGGSGLRHAPAGGLARGAPALAAGDAAGPQRASARRPRVRFHRQRHLGVPRRRARRDRVPHRALGRGAADARPADARAEEVNPFIF